MSAVYSHTHTHTHTHTVLVLPAPPQIALTDWNRTWNKLDPMIRVRRRCNSNWLYSCLSNRLRKMKGLSE